VVGRVVGRADHEHGRGRRAEAAQGLVVRRHDLAGLGEQRHPGRGQPGTAPVRLDNGPADRPLKPPDVLADRGLAEPEVSRRLAEAPSVGHRDQTPQGDDVQLS